MKCAHGKCGCSPHRRGLCKAHYRTFLSARPRGMVPIGPVRDHVNQLMAAGLSQQEVADRAGVSRRATLLYGVFNPERVQIRKITADKILSVEIPELIGPGEKARGYMPAIGTIRRLRALMAIGYEMSELSEAAKVSLSTISKLVNGREDIVITSIARRVDEVFRRYQMTPKKSTRSINRALRQGWPPPLAWDEYSIDDPDATPDIGEKPKPSAWIDDYKELKEWGMSDEKIARRMNLAPGSLQVKLHRYSVKTGDIKRPA